MPDAPVRPDQAHFFAADTGLGVVDQLDETAAPTSLWADAWQSLRRRPLFWISAALITLVLLVAAFPTMFTSLDPRFCELRNSLADPSAGHPFGFDRQGCDIYARTIHGARASVATGVLTTLFVLLVGGSVGAVAGFFGGWFDALLSRVTDVFFAIPLVLAAIVVMQMFKESRSVLTVVLVLGIFGWPQLARVTRGAVMAVRGSEFVTAARALGSSRFATLVRHVAPNASGPVIVTSTVALGTYIVAEATLSFLGIGLPPQITSWGADIAKAQASLRSQPMVLFYPSAALALTVLSFIMMGDAVRDALDPKARTR
ncbi:ABC transporter permease [Cellulomonas chengniuliangii]|uniref:ABC transporter permease n=1 Tax=Cellulomonas chengniuliangii TaxID=2968084 RepID=A0ABY5KV92_9CELL|nr:ABC transporter permease [Cellulomonas chengniuliangii]MCC2308901.1 ABC transporter permease [Cellulomonas chengniuliangii]MCC2319428.1 ABC transporter permease [Cellulomonas chengniuliangii]UUI74359.1 ABC transporter permease [Cellulomonas chengniuliangii]